MSFSTLFEPESVVVICASRNEVEVRYAVFKNVFDEGFLGRIYPVNRKADDVPGLRYYPAFGRITVHNTKKVERAAPMLEPAVDFDRIYSALELKH